MHDVDLEDARMARVVICCEELPGQNLFQYLDDEGEPSNVNSEDVNAYLQACSGEDFTAKDFRTWTGTVLAAWALEEQGGVRSETQATRQAATAVKSVSQALGNTPAWPPLLHPSRCVRGPPRRHPRCGANPAAGAAGARPVGTRGGRSAAASTKRAGMTGSNRDLPGSGATPIYIVTACADGIRAGCVADSTQVNINPPRFLACVSKQNATYPVARAANRLAVHLVPKAERGLATLLEARPAMNSTSSHSANGSRRTTVLPCS